MCPAYLDHVFVDLLGVPVDQVNLLGVAVFVVLLFADVVLVRHGGATSPEQGRKVDEKKETERETGEWVLREVEE